MIRIEQALARAKEQGKKIKKKDLAALLWPDSSVAGQRVNMTGLIAGRREAVRPEWIEIICRETGVTADFLLGISNY